MNTLGKVILIGVCVGFVLTQDQNIDFDGDNGGSFVDGQDFDYGTNGGYSDVGQEVFGLDETALHETAVLPEGHVINRRSVDSDFQESRAERVRRSGYGFVGPVHTYVKTDYHGNFKWGAKHLVGSKFGGGRGGYH
ncbi:uncharacterized protein LOC143251215 [Tachypleus tridentatus]|uniref:uncharacterized protein LOC143251215 n=1 Tax=Tachypleus tridentatus TaxID=6853 RepID=UPI003FD5F1D7